MLGTFIFGVISSIVFLLIQNIFTYDLFGLEYPILQQIRPVQEKQDVQNTSRLVSAWRALDSKLPNSVYYQQDQMAEAMAGPEMMALMQEELAESFRAPESNEVHAVTLRQLAINNRIMNYSSPHDSNEGIKQVVLIGSGLDTRPYRLVLPDTIWFEVDMPEVIAMKEVVVEEQSPTLTVKKRTQIPLNLATSTNVAEDLKNALSSHGHNANEPTLFLMEGLVMYLAPSTVTKLMNNIATIASPGSRVIISQVSFIIHYLLTNPIFVFLMENFYNMKSMQIGFLFKSNLRCTSLGSFWHTERISNIGLEMFEAEGLTQWQLSGHEVGTPPKLLSTAEFIIDASYVSN